MTAAALALLSASCHLSPSQFSPYPSLTLTPSLTGLPLCSNLGHRDVYALSPAQPSSSSNSGSRLARVRVSRGGGRQGMRGCRDRGGVAGGSRYQEGEQSARGCSYGEEGRSNRGASGACVGCRLQGKQVWRDKWQGARGRGPAG